MSRRSAAALGVLVVASLAAIDVGRVGATALADRPSCDTLPAASNRHRDDVAGAVVQAADLAPGWRLQKMFLRRPTDQGFADGIGERSLGGSQTFAERGRLRDDALQLTSIVELERSPRIACRAWERHRDRDLGELRPLDAAIGAAAFLRYSDNRVLGPYYEVSWFRGPVLALVEVQLADAKTDSEARKEAVRLARLQDERLAALLARERSATFRPRRVAGLDTSRPEPVAVAWLRATAYRCTFDAKLADAIALPRATRPATRPCEERLRFRVVGLRTIGDTASVGVQAFSPSGRFVQNGSVVVFAGRTPAGWRAHSTTLLP